MKYCIAAGVFTFLLASLVLCQASTKRRLVLTGSIVSVKAKYDLESDKKNQIVFDVDLYLQFRNETDGPIIIFRPGGFFGNNFIEKKITFLDGYSSRSESEKSSSVAPWKNISRADYDPFRYFKKELTASEPPKEIFFIIEPGGYYECHDTLTVRRGYKVELKPKQMPWEVPAIPEYSELRVQYHLSVNDRATEDTLGTIQTKWSKFGELPLDSNGDYTVKSEIILNKLPE